MRRTDFQDVKNSATLISYPKLMFTQGRERRRLINDNPRSHENMNDNLLRIREAGHGGEHKFR